MKVKKLKGETYSEYLSRLGQSSHRLSTSITMQMCEDAAVIANNSLFGIGPRRSQDFVNEFRTVMNEIAEMSNNNGPDNDYARAKIDSTLSRIRGKFFIPWDQRYHL